MRTFNLCVFVAFIFCFSGCATQVVKPKPSARQAELITLRRQHQAASIQDIAVVNSKVLIVVNLYGTFSRAGIYPVEPNQANWRWQMEDWCSHTAAFWVDRTTMPENAEFDVQVELLEGQSTTFGFHLVKDDLTNWYMSNKPLVK